MKLTNDERAALVERVHGEVLSVYTDGHDHHVSDLYFHANRIIALVRQDERRRIAAAIEAMYDRVKAENTDIMGGYDQETAGILAGLSDAIGITEELT